MNTNDQKAAIVREDGYVQNVVVWDETCVPVPGITAVVVPVDTDVAPGYTYDGESFHKPQVSDEE